MKKAIMIMAAIATMACISGCFTSAYTITETKNADGSSTYSKAKVTGMGDKAAQVAAEGMYSDGTLEDLGAGFKNANAAQTSTGIDGALKGIGDVLIGLASLQRAYGGGINPVLPAQAGSATATPQYAPPTSTKGGNFIAGEGVPEIVIIGDRSSCSICRGLWASLDPLTMSLNACDASIIDADANDNPSIYKARRPAGAFSFPYIRIYVGGKVVDEFSARGMSQEQITARANKSIGSCAPSTD